jgi:hypothetical protein
MKVELLLEAGYAQAMLGLSLSHNQPIENMPDVANRLCDKDGGHNKFLESIVVWLDVTAPRYWWQQFDTYRVGVTKQSESTMHTLLDGYLTQSNFEGGINPLCLLALNIGINRRLFNWTKRHLPESFLQRRIVCTNYKTLRRIIQQRSSHRLPEWQQFIAAIENLTGGL